MRNLSGIETIPDNIFRYKCYLCHKNGFYSIKVMCYVFSLFVVYEFSMF